MWHFFNLSSSKTQILARGRSLISRNTVRYPLDTRTTLYERVYSKKVIFAVSIAVRIFQSTYI